MRNRTARDVQGICLETQEAERRGVRWCRGTDVLKMVPLTQSLNSAMRQVN